MSVSPTKEKSAHTIYTRLFWLALTIYLVVFLGFAWQDLYAPQVTVGLYSEHHSPYEHAFGYVIDPKPNRSLAAELKSRLRQPTLPKVTDYDSIKNNLEAFVVDAEIRPPKVGEILVGQGPAGEEVLVFNEYLGQWVTFRPGIGILLETKQLTSMMKVGLILKVVSQ